MIIRIVVVDPRPRDAKDDTVVYQVPENSRSHGLLIELLDGANLDYVAVECRAMRRGREEKTS